MHSAVLGFRLYELADELHWTNDIIEVVLAAAELLEVLLACRFDIDGDGAGQRYGLLDGGVG